MSGDIRQTSSNSLLNQTPIKTKPYSSNAISIQVSKQSTSGKSSIHEKHLQSTDMIRDIVIEGMSDGLTVPFALAAGMTGAVSDTGIIGMAGLVEIVGGSIAMSLGGYLAGKTEVEHYESELEREYEEVDSCPDVEKQEVREALSSFGISEETQHLFAEELSRDKKKWVDFMMKFELGLEKPAPNRARDSGITIGLAYIFGGLIPLSPYFIISHAHSALLVSVFITLFTLFSFGYIKSKVTGQKDPLVGAVKVMLIGAVAASCAYIVAGVFRPDSRETPQTGSENSGYPSCLDNNEQQLPFLPFPLG